MNVMRSMAQPELIYIILTEEEAVALRKGKKPHVKEFRRRLKMALR